MPADFGINLAKDLTSSDEERNRFYNSMLIYLAICAVFLVLVAYLTSMNVMTYLNNRAEHEQLVITTTAVSGIERSDFKNPELVYTELETYSRRIEVLKRLLGKRVQLLPIVYNLFSDMPEGVALQSLSADNAKLSFGLVMPSLSGQTDAVKELRAAWESNEELMRRVSSIRPLTGERRTMNGNTVFYVQFECLLKK